MSLIEWIAFLLTDEYYSNCPIHDEKVIDDQTIELKLTDGSKVRLKMESVE